MTQKIAATDDRLDSKLETDDKSELEALEARKSEIQTNLVKLKKAFSEKSELDPATANIKSFQMEF